MEKNNGYLLGCNYWGSQHAIYMWRNYDKAGIEKDIKALAKKGVNILRIFPLWPDFQPINRVALFNNMANDRFSFKVRQGDTPLMYNEYENKSGLDKKMVDNMNHFISTAGKYGVQVVVSILTGWMSGRKLFPEVLVGKNLVTDAEAVIWECRFIKDLISQIKHHDNILAYEPGNETNCLPGGDCNSYEAERWLMNICGAIREADPNKPVHAGMHCTSCTMRFHLPMQGRYFDMVTPHPYPCFTPYCQLEKLTEMRASMHAAAESSYYRSITNKPVMVQEIGNMGPMFLNNDLVPEYFEKALMTSYFAGSKGFLWWCAFEQRHLDFAPYDMQAMETELGLANADRTPKPVLNQLAELRVDIDEMGEMNVPEFDGVAILQNAVDHWGVAYGSYMLGVQSGYNIDYCFEAQPIKDSDYYILSCCADGHGLPKRQAMDLYDRVKKGANLLVTCDFGTIWDIEEMSGLKVMGVSAIPHVKTFTLNGKEMSIACKQDFELESVTANVIARDKEGRIVVAENKVGKGRVVFVNAPLETHYVQMNYPEKTALYEIYKFFFKKKAKVVEMDNSSIYTTVHKLSDGKVGVTFYNFDKENNCIDATIKGYKVEKSYFAKFEDGKICFEKPYAYFVLSKN